ncbi:SDR family NAD(P)-dependent oxidoreductase [Aquiflexum lacus]|uniref:SDR family NAD(P)-dependent oxidoreductase n=1 Tax=Aquiflexum lacus TaxID=2483805 RepID=UPI001894465C|nr:SDR family NAD(P)-dependent oxidoreductase [Aquiflexum lacus]
MKTVLITGASSGIGKETAKLFRDKGFQVIATSRRVENMVDLEEIGCFVLSMDVTKEVSIENAFQKIFSKTKQIDILVNNAGYCQNGFVEELTMENLHYQFDVNVFGLIRVTQKVLPLMRKNRNGRIINIGSVGGDFTSAGASAYHASKYALESFSDGLRQELAPFGIQVVLVKPGGVETDFLNHSKVFYPEPLEGNPYGKMRTNFGKMIDSILNSSNSAFPILKPKVVAEIIVQSSVLNKPKSRIRIGRTAKIMPVMKRLLSDQAFDKMILNQLGLLK